MRLKNAWASGTAYVNDTSYIDIVTYNGNTYACIKSHTASSSIIPTNTTYWLQIAAKGATGATGAKGDKGDTGAKVPPVQPEQKATKAIKVIARRFRLIRMDI